MPALLSVPIPVRPAPIIDPPFDDETGEVRTALVDIQPALPLDWAARSRPDLRWPAGWPGPHHGRPASARAIGGSVPAAVAASASQGAASPARGAVMHFMSLCLEVLNGYRPPRHLRTLVSPVAFTPVTAELSRAMARLALPGTPARARPQRPPPTEAAVSSRVRLRLLRVCEPKLGVAEAAAVLGHHSSVWALAVRLERRQSGWVCTLAQLI